MKRTRIIIIAMIGAVCLLAGCRDNGMRYARILDTAQQQNVDYDSITHIDSIEDAVRYFDSHGSTNEKVHAHYILGCAYRDAGEAPKALECFHDASDCADTTKADCDYNLLVRVHAQMADLFYKQLLPYDMLSELEAQYKCALYAGDTLSAINSIERKAGVYYLLNMPDSIIIIRKTASQLYVNHGYIKEAAYALGPLVDKYVDKGDLVEAKKCIDFYEKESGAVKNGEVNPSKATYYYSKGRYYLAKGDADSAQFFFRKLLSPEKTDNQREAGYRGLYLLYRQIDNKDSVAKYADLSYQANEAEYAIAATENMRHMQSLYNYSRSQKLAQQMTEKARRNEWIIYGVVMLTLILLSIIYFRWREIRRKRQEAYEKLKTLLEREKENLRKAKTDLSSLEMAYAEMEEHKNSEYQTLKQDTDNAIEKLMEEKNSEILLLGEHIKSLEEKLKIERKKVTDQDLYSTPIYKRIKTVLSVPKEKMHKDDWEKLRLMIDEVIPSLYSEMNSHKKKLKRLDYHICILVRLHFSNNDIAFLTDNSPQNISMKRLRLLKNIFGIDGTAEQFDKLIQEIGRA